MVLFRTKKVLADYCSGDIIDRISGGVAIPEMLLQYEESDWVFLRRLCSHFGGYLMTDAADSRGRVYFGTPDNRYGTELEKQDYVLVKDLLHYARVLEPEGILSQEVTGWKIRSRAACACGRPFCSTGWRQSSRRWTCIQKKGNWSMDTDCPERQA